MSTLTAWKFNTPHGADDALVKLEKLHGEMVINLHDAAVVSWDAELIRTNMSDEQEAKLRAVFGLEE